MLSQLLEVPAAEFRPPSRIVPKPFTQRGARGYFLNPLIDRRVRLFDPARPKPINQYPFAIIGRGRLVGSFKPEVGDWILSAHDGALNIKLKEQAEN